MRLFNLVLVFLLLTMTSSFLQANPVIVFYFNELKVDYSDWIIELYSDFPTVLDGWQLTSLSDTACLKNGMVLDGNYLLITPDSLLTPFHLNPAGDEVMLYDNMHILTDVISFGDVPGYSMIEAPLPGQSICLFGNTGNWEYFNYLDNSPSLGLKNDSTNGCGNVEGIVTDSSGYPLDNVQVVYGYYMDSLGSYVPKVTQTNSAGFFRVRDYAKNITFEFFRENFQNVTQRIQNWPDSTVSMQVMIEPVVSISDEPVMKLFTLLANYPNPFNGLTRIGFNLSTPTVLELSIYDLLGRKIKILFKDFRAPGSHFIFWNGRDENNQEVSSGVYIFELIAGNQRESRKMLLVR
jgi:hypothetical protein